VRSQIDLIIALNPKVPLGFKETLDQALALPYLTSQLLALTFVQCQQQPIRNIKQYLTGDIL
jgi:hypothetical protein